MPRITTHAHFSAYLDRFLTRIARDTGETPARSQNILQFIIALGAGVDSSQAPLSFEFLPHRETPMKTIIHILTPNFTRDQTQKIVEYFNSKHGTAVAEQAFFPYLEIRHPYISILSGALIDEIDAAAEYRDISEMVQQEIVQSVLDKYGLGAKGQ